MDVVINATAALPHFVLWRLFLSSQDGSGTNLTLFSVIIIFAFWLWQIDCNHMNYERPGK